MISYETAINPHSLVFLKPTVKPHFLLKAAIPSETLDAFCTDRGKFFLVFPKPMRKFEFKEHGEKVQSTLGHSSLLTSEIGLSLVKVTFRECPLVWDTGALFGLTLFRGNCIDYVECQIPVKDISCTNMVIVMGTTLHKFEANGKPIWLPCLSYHLPSAEIRLFIHRPTTCSIMVIVLSKGTVLKHLLVNISSQFPLIKRDEMCQQFSTLPYLGRRLQILDLTSVLLFLVLNGRLIS